VGTRALFPSFRGRGIVPITEAPGTLGAGFTPEAWAAYVLDNLSAASVLLASGATEVRTQNKQIHVPRFTGNGTVGWYGELDPITEGAPPGDELVLTPKKAAALVTLSNEVVTDSSPSVLNAVGNKMVKSVALEADRAMFAGTGGDQPTGLLNLAPPLPSQVGAVDYANIVRASGMVSAAGGIANALYVNPADYVALQLVTSSDDRPLISGDPTQGAPPVIAGLRVFPTPATPAATALVAEAGQIVVAVREDASVAVSEDAAFNADGTAVRVIARVDVGVNDPDGLCVIKAAAGRSKS
jgi:HK97 family phage major capsid protein